MSEPPPFVRFSRDRRGYEHFYLLQPARRGRDRQKILYWFRTPPNVKVGRAPFDAEMQRAIEAQHPDVAFDWASLLDFSIPPLVEAERWRERRRERRAQRAAGAGASAPSDVREERRDGTPSEPAADGAPQASNQEAGGEPRAGGRRRRRRHRGTRRDGPTGEVGASAAPDTEPGVEDGAGQ